MPDPKLADRIKRLRTEGIPEGGIQQILSADGWKETDVLQALAYSVNTPTVTVAPVTRKRFGVGALLFAVLLGLCALGGTYYLMMNRTFALRPANELHCAGFTVPLPDAWAQLESIAGPKLDSDGCTGNETGCICLKKDPSQATKALAFSASVSTPSDGFILDDLSRVVTDPISAEQTSNLSGYPAIEFVSTGSSKTGTFAILRKGKLYRFDFGAKSEEEFSKLWPEIKQSIRDMQFE